MRSEKGFSLVELLVVIVILGVLAGIVVFAVGRSTEHADKNACATDQQTYKSAVESFKLHDAGREYPDQNSDILGSYVESASNYWTVTNNSPDRIQAIGGVALPAGCVNDPNS